MYQETGIRQPTGSKSWLTPAVKESILNTIVTAGMQSLTKLFNNDPYLPSYGTVIAYRRQDPDFDANVAKAMSLRAEMMMEDMLETINDTSNDFKQNDRGEFIPNYETSANKALKMKAFSWIAPKLNAGFIETKHSVSTVEHVTTTEEFVKSLPPTVVDQPKVTANDAAEYTIPSDIEDAEYVYVTNGAEKV